MLLPEKRVLRKMPLLFTAVVFTEEFCQIWLQDHSCVASRCEIIYTEQYTVKAAPLFCCTLVYTQLCGKVLKMTVNDA